MSYKDDFKTAFSQNLSRLLREKKVNRRNLAEQVGVSYPAIASYLAGRTVGKGALPSLDTAAQLAAALGVSLDELCRQQPLTQPAKERPTAPAPGETEAQRQLRAIYTAAQALGFEISTDDKTIVLKSANHFVRLFFNQLQGGSDLEKTLAAFRDVHLCGGELVDPITYEIMGAKG